MSDPSSAPPDPAVRAAFLATSYGTADRRYRLSAERPSDLLPSFFGRGECWAILTAWNPGVERLTPEENATRQTALRAALAGARILEGRNGEGEWAEPSLIVTRLPLRRACRLARDFGQLALIWGCGQRAALVWCGSGLTERRWLSTL